MYHLYVHSISTPLYPVRTASLKKMILDILFLYSIVELGGVERSQHKTNFNGQGSFSYYVTLREQWFCYVNCFKQWVNISQMI